MAYATRRGYQLTTSFNYTKNCRVAKNLSPRINYHISKSPIAFKKSCCHHMNRCGFTSEAIFFCCQLVFPIRQSHRYFFHSYPLLTNLTSRNQVGKTENMNDNDYMEFLNKANEIDVQSNRSGKFELKNLDQNLEIPEVLQKATQEAYYISDADEPFVPVVLKVKDGIPDEVSFAKLVNHPEPANAEVQIMNTNRWDPHGQYKNIIDSVREAAQNDQIRVYQIVLSSTISEYWLVGVKDELLLGVKAVAVES
ncbi:hypothetical protein OnM2_032035 [Erysiphe neolycopersici]|uniref:Uncharacterized protein n=1 Tax=Erysiphe neolycopersici TaxID=212602 RepID=A0A420HYP3_9PEZI|nr:hypothetical protein OnM2_032035 [Erysiphe neolycopersici]